jgi:hypothetical protein
MASQEKRFLPLNSLIFTVYCGNTIVYAT